MKDIKIILSKEAQEVYEYLLKRSIVSKRESSILTAIHEKKELIKSNVHYGNPIAKNLIPNEYKLKYGITNLFRVELPSFWRMLYTLTNGESKIEIIAFIIEISDHATYNKRFRYKK